MQRAGRARTAHPRLAVLAAGGNDAWLSPVVGRGRRPCAESGAAGRRGRQNGANEPSTVPPPICHCGATNSGGGRSMIDRAARPQRWGTASKVLGGAALIAVAFRITVALHLRQSRAPAMAGDDRSTDDTALPGVDTVGDELPVSYTLAGGRIGVASRCEYLRTVVDAALWLCLAPIPARVLRRTGAPRASVHAQRWWARCITRALELRLDLEGLNLIDPSEAYVVVPLHEGFADALALLQLPLRLRFVVRDELAEWRLLGAFLRDTEQIVIRPEEGGPAYRRLVRAALPVFAAGESLVVFPQGSILGIETDFLGGAFSLARLLERPILPIALTGGHRVWEHPYSPRLRRGQRMSLRVLAPVFVAEVRSTEADELRCGVRDRLKAEALDGTMAPPRRFTPTRDGYWDGYAYAIDPAFPELAAEIETRQAQRVDS